MSNSDVIKILEQLASQGVQPRGISVDSRTVQPGDIFVAMPGLTVDGRRFMAAAVDQGAVAVLYAPGGDFTPPPLTVPVLAVDQLTELSADLAVHLYAHPSHHLWMVGVTGTNGKTTVSQWIAAAINATGHRCGVIGTLGAGFPGTLQDAVNTTPCAVDVQKTLARLYAEGAEAVVMETSSIGLVEGRVRHVAFDVAVFTNLSRDHLDYHQTMAAYADAKKRLFESPEVQHAIINIDDPAGFALTEFCVEQGMNVIACSMADQSVDLPPGAQSLRAENMKMSPVGLMFDVCWQQQRCEIQARLIAPFNVANLLAVIAVLLVRGVSLDNAAYQASCLQPPAGRMQVLGGIGEPLVVVDYAHSPDAMEKALLAVRSTVDLRNGKLTCVFGCGGNRDVGKRPLMGAAAEALSDYVIVTSDNPRHEDPDKILRDIVSGMARSESSRVELIENRATAIAQAIARADENDVILVAGKGHETYQEVRGQRADFSDVEHARCALMQRRQRQESES